MYVELYRVSRNIDSSHCCSSSSGPARRLVLAPGIIQHWGLLVRELQGESGDCLTMELYEAGRVQY